jgi:hypothetical protein
MPAGDFDPQQRQRLVVRAGVRRWRLRANRRLDAFQPIGQRARERDVERRPARPGDDETAATVGRDVAFGGRADVEPAAARTGRPGPDGPIL